MTTIYVTDTTELPKRAEKDFYRTERTLIAAALDRFCPASAGAILDIGAGDGRWGLEAQRITGAPYLAGVEIRDVPAPAGYSAWFTTDFLQWSTTRPFDVIVSNPPFSQAEPIVRRALGMLADGGTMIFLLPLDFMASIERAEGLWQECPPVTVGVCARRPSFYKSARGNSNNGTNYGVYHWEKGQGLPGQWQAITMNYAGGD